MGAGRAREKAKKQNRKKIQSPHRGVPAAGQVDIAAAMSITFVTGNKKKLEEVKAILSGVLDNITNVSVSLFALCGPEPHSSALSH